MYRLKHKHYLIGYSIIFAYLNVVLMKLQLPGMTVILINVLVITMSWLIRVEGMSRGMLYSILNPEFRKKMKQIIKENDTRK
jgi:uncharacterized membrane protein YjgN (DUF898 family)